MKNKTIRQCHEKLKSYNSKLNCHAFSFKSAVFQILNWGFKLFEARSYTELALLFIQFHNL